jgi:hypothetical protein
MLSLVRLMGPWLRFSRSQYRRSGAQLLRGPERDHLLRRAAPPRPGACASLGVRLRRMVATTPIQVLLLKRAGDASASLCEAALGAKVAGATDSS